VARTPYKKEPRWRRDIEGSVLIVGQQNLHNELVAYGLHQITGLRCRLVPKPDEKGPEADSDQEHKTLVLVDFTDTRLNEIPGILSAYALIRDPPIPLALYNLEPGTGCEAAAVNKGVSGFFYIHETLELFLRGIRAVLDGQIWLPRGILVDAVMSRLTGRKTEPGRHDELTSREVEVLSLLSRGAGNEEIAGALGIGRNTVRTHLHSVFRKLGVANRAQAALWAAKHL